MVVHPINITNLLGYLLLGLRSLDERCAIKSLELVGRFWSSHTNNIHKTEKRNLWWVHFHENVQKNAKKVWHFVETNPELKVAIVACDQIRISEDLTFLVLLYSCFVKRKLLCIYQNLLWNIGLISRVWLVFWDVGVITSKSCALQCFPLGCSAVLINAPYHLLPLPLTIIQPGSCRWTFLAVSMSVSWPGRWVVTYPSSPPPLLNLVLLGAQGHEQFERDCNGSQAL